MFSNLSDFFAMSRTVVSHSYTNADSEADFQCRRLMQVPIVVDFVVHELCILKNGKNSCCSHRYMTGLAKTSRENNSYDSKKVKNSFFFCFLPLSILPLGRAVVRLDCDLHYILHCEVVLVGDPV